MVAYGTFARETNSGTSWINRKLIFIFSFALVSFGIGILAAYVFWSGAIPGTTNPAPKKCVPRKFNHSSVVCVCNATYCDTAPSVGEVRNGTFLMITSSQDGMRFHTETGKFQDHDETVEDKNKNKTSVIYYIDRSNLKQKIVGFGGTFTDSAGVNILGLSQHTQFNLLRSYFSTDGIQYTLGRVPMGSTDFSTQYYSYDDVAGDVTLKHFKLPYPDLKLKIPLINSANSITGKNLKLLGTAWSAPIWMKTPHNISGGSLDLKYYQTWADYHAKFIDEYGKNGIPIWALTSGNEPNSYLYSTGSFSMMKWLPIDHSKWIVENFGPTLNNSGVLLFSLDDNRGYIQQWAKEVFGNENAVRYLNGLCVHGYDDSKVSTQGLLEFHNKYPDKMILYSEFSIGVMEKEKVALGSWSRAERYFDEIVQNLNNEVAGWTDFNLALDGNGGPVWNGSNADSPIIVNKTADEFYKEPMFYAIGHISKYIPPHSIRIEVAQDNSTGLDLLVAKRPDDMITIVLCNRLEEKKNVSFVDKLSGNLTLQIPPKSINTIVYR